MLEDRRLLDGSMTFHHLLLDPTSSGGSPNAAIGSPTPVGRTPQQIRAAYGIDSIELGSVVGDGTGQTIAIVAVYDNPKLVSSTDTSFFSSDLHQFDMAFGLPDPPSFRKLDQNGGVNYPGVDPAGPGADRGWEAEEALDVEWAHAIAPQANIVLIEARSRDFGDLSTAINTARNMAGVSVVSMSFGWPEDQGDPATNAARELSMDALFTTPAGHQGVTFVAASGDDGSPGTYPAYSPNVLAVGGTSLTTNSDGSYEVEYGWNGSGGGQSMYEPEPSYQSAVQNTGFRQIPDVAFDGDPNTGVAIYDSYDFGNSRPWAMVGGTSLGAPCWAGLIAIANQLRASQGLGTLDGRSQTLPGLYAMPEADFHDVTIGTVDRPAVGPGYDEVTGLGTPVANKLVSDLAFLIQGVPPTIVGAAPSPTASLLDVGSIQRVIRFSEPVVGGDNVANYDLHSMGPDGLLGTADDINVPLIASVDWSRTVATLTFAPLPEGIYRLIVKDTIIDLRGNKLDGNGDGKAGGDSAKDFVTISASPSFSIATIYQSGTGSSDGVVTGDFNNDGELDIAVATATASLGGINILFGKGDGSFSSPRGIPLSFDAVSVVANDFNKDGKLDIVAGSCFGDRIAVLMGDGRGGFSSPTYYDVAGNRIDAGDFNGDDRIDLILTANYTPSSAAILFGDGNGGFSAPSSLGNFSSSSVVASEDFNGDGMLDLAIGIAGMGGGNGSIKVFLGDGNGSFSPPTTIFGSSGYDFSCMKVGDFNADGKLDLVFAEFLVGRIGILFGDGNGGFSPPLITGPSIQAGDIVYDIAAGDFNGDGALDLAATFRKDYIPQFGVLLGDGSGGLSDPICFTVDSSPMDIAVGDFNGDGRCDLAVAGSNTSILMNLGGASLPFALTSAHSSLFDTATGTFGTGQFVQGGCTGNTNAFNGYGRLVVGGLRFQPNTLSSNTSDDGQSLVTGNGTFSGLSVSRKITVPNTGNEDFARTIDTFTNPTNAPITTTVQILGNLGSDAGTTVFATSDGDNTVESSDQWIGTDGNGTPAIVHYIHGPGGLKPSSVGLIGDNIQWTYNLTVPAGQTVQLAYFTIVSPTRTEAVAAAQAMVTRVGFDGQATAFLSSADAASLGNFQFPPITATVSLNAHSPLTNDVLTATATKSDADSDPVSLTYVWKVNGTVQRTFTSATALSDTFDLSLAGNGSRGDTVTVEVTPSDGALTGTTVTDTATIANTRPTAAIVLNTHSPLTNDVLTATATKSDADGDAVALTYVWKVNGTVQRTFTSATALSDTFDLSLAGNGSRGDAVTVEVTPSDGTLTGTTVNDTATVIDATPSASVTTPSSPQSGAVTIGYSLTDADADLCDINVQYSTDGGTTWNTASPASGGDGTMALASSPGGTTHTYVWASDENLVSTSHSNVRIRITPISTVVGTAGTSGVFTVDKSAVLTIPSSTIGLYSPTTSVCYLRNTNNVGFADETFSYGPADAGWLPIAGDWNGDGTDSVGLYNPATSVFYLRNANTVGYADLTFAYGMADAGWLPIAGDWDGDGTDSVGLYNPATSVFYLRNANTTGYADLTFTYGMANVGWLPIAGDWNNDGSDTIGLYSPTTAVFYLRNTNTAGFADLTFAYGLANAGWKPIVGDWNANGTDTIGLYSPTTSTFYLRDRNDAGFADSTFAYGPANAGWTPIVGGWHGSSGSSLRAAACSVPDATVNHPLRAVDPRAVDQIDLPTVVALELGQVAGSDDPDALSGDLMSSRLPRAI
jgi:hypothetical protein